MEDLSWEKKPEQLRITAAEGHYGFLIGRKKGKLLRERKKGDSSMQERKSERLLEA